MNSTDQKTSPQSKSNSRINHLNQKNTEELLIKRALNPDWVKAGVRFVGSAMP